MPIRSMQTLTLWTFVPLAVACAGDDTSGADGSLGAGGMFAGAGGGSTPSAGGAATVGSSGGYTAGGGTTFTGGATSASGGSTGAAGLANGGSSSGSGGLTAAGGSEGTSTGGSTESGGETPGAGTKEDSGAGCTIPNLPPSNQLTPYEKHADPFMMLDGSRITQKSQWPCRRAEIKAQVEEYESGPKPVVSPENVTGTFSGDTLTVTVKEGSEEESFSIKINRPGGASGSIPLLISLYGFGSITLDGSVFSQNGVATAMYNNNQIGAQSGQGSRGSGLFYQLYGSDHPASSMIAWAWGISRIIDALEKTPEANIDPTRIAVTGCSRDGKGALTAGAFDERIVLTIPQESGAGGSASWRVSQAKSSQGENVQTLSSAAGEQPWFRSDFGSNFGGGNVTRLPFDHHTVMGMVAPRALLVIDNRIDWLGIDSTYTAGSIANEIWQAFGLGDHMGYWQTGGHQHCAFPSEQRSILEAYVKKFLVGDGTDDTNMVRAQSANADLDYWMEWSAPDLQ